MSKGTPVQTFRLDPSLKREVMETIERRNYNAREELWTLSDFIAIALREKIAKMERSRMSTESRRAARKIMENRFEGVELVEEESP